MSRYPDPGQTATKKFTANQIALFTFFFGPITAVILLKKNFDAMKDSENAKKTVIYGLIATLAFFLVAPFIPESIPSIVFSAAYAFAAKQYHESTQKEALEDVERESNWKAFGLSLLGILAAVIAISVILFAYDALGIINLEL